MSNLSEKPAQVPSGNMPRSMPKMSDWEGILQTFRSGLHTNHQPLFMNRRGIRRKQKREEKDCFSSKSLVLATKPQTTVFFQYQYNISPYSGEFFCRMMQTSDLNHNPMHIPTWENRQTLPFSHPLDGQNSITAYSACPILYKCPSIS